ncbi:hypothetical protein [Burkholderia sp. Ac-20349]|nr:hypothetical protein [Burkholderia sp. Ac-20349]MBN3838568.1 hypothetical protein [Burkholderia sp. Ac-20349]
MVTDDAIEVGDELEQAVDQGRLVKSIPSSRIREEGCHICRFQINT